MHGVRTIQCELQHQTLDSPPDDAFEVERFLARVRTNGRICFDIEHDPDLNWREPGFYLWGMSVYTDGDGPHHLTDPDDIRRVLCCFDDPSIEKIAHNAKYDLICLIRAEYLTETPSGVVCTLCATNLLDELLNESQLGLKPTVLREFGHKMMEFKDAVKFGRDSKEFMAYACEDAYWEYRLWVLKSDQLEKANLRRYFDRVLMLALPAFVDIELDGHGWDHNEAISCFNELRKVGDELFKKIKSSLGNIDINSPKQLSKRLFGELGYSTKYTEKGKSGDYCTDAAVMDKMAGKYPVCADICVYRTCEKMISTYLTPLNTQAARNFDHRVRGSFWLQSKTGRTRCSNANLQNVPVSYNMPDRLRHVNLRNCFVPRNDFDLLVCDYSQIELRMCAQVSGDRTFLSSFKDWTCSACGSKGSSDVILHSCPKCGVGENERVLKGEKGFWHGLDLHQITTDSVAALDGDRAAGKVANFALIYLAQPFTMHNHFPKFSADRWEEIIEQYFEKYSGVREWHRRMERQMNSTGVAYDLFGRPRKIQKKSIRDHYKHSLNQFVNSPVQGSAVSLALNVMGKLREFFRSNGMWRRDIIQVNMVHDENVFEVRRSMMNEIRPEVTRIMETSVPFKVPIRVDTKVVQRWGHAKG